ncbi:MAG: MSMEG_4193 family putative phosphomutase [Chloroflexaceae bacterium]|nr:MSMEG_4193 family putative phosphomutase [Chloroflexaceae bacterium]
MTLLILIRHATNDWVKGRLAGWTPGVSLNDEGKEQARRLGERMAHLPLAAIYSSPLERAVETAQAIAAPHQQEVRVVEGLGEVRYGDWTGAELKELTCHELWPGVQFYPSGTRFPGGETLGEVQHRAVETLDGLRAQHGEREVMVAVSHADLIKLVVAYYVGIHLDLFQRLVISPASLTALVFERMGPRLVAFNDTGSLALLQAFTAASDHPEQETAPRTEQEAMRTEEPDD